MGTIILRQLRLGFCDPAAGVAFGYVTGEMGPRWQNPRNRALLDAVYASL